MNQKKFFQQLRSELFEHPYRERFLEELEAHAEDLKQEKLKENEWEKRMGKPLSVKENFMKIMHPFGKLFFILEGLFYGVLFVPLTLLTYFILRGSLYFQYGELGWGQFFYRSFEGTTLLIILLILLTLFGLYFFSYQRFLTLEKASGLSKRMWQLLVFGPGIITLTLNFFFEITNEFGVKVGPVLIVSIVMIYFMMHFLSSYFAWKLNESKEKNIIVTKILNSLTIVGAIFFVLCIFYRTIISHFSTPATLPESVGFLNIFSPLYFIEINLGKAWTGLMNASLESVDLFTAVYIPILLILFLTLQSLWIMIRQKKVYLLRSVLVIYTLSLFFISPSHLINQPDFKVPYIHVSKLIEKHEFGLFYPIIKYFNANEGALLKYDVGYQVGISNAMPPAIQTNIGKTYYLELPSKYPDEKWGHLSFKDISAGSTGILPFKLTPYELMNGHLPPNFTSEKEYIQSIIPFANENILKRHTALDSVVFTENRKWALVVVSNRFYDYTTSSITSQEVYLVKLKN